MPEDIECRELHQGSTFLLAAHFRRFRRTTKTFLHSYKWIAGPKISILALILQAILLTVHSGLFNV